MRYKLSRNKDYVTYWRVLIRKGSYRHATYAARQLASSCPVCARWRDRFDRLTRPVGQGVAPNLRHQYGTSGNLTLRNAGDRPEVEELGKNSRTIRSDRHEEAQLPRNDLAEEAVGPQAVAHPLTTQCVDREPRRPRTSSHRPRSFDRGCCLGNQSPRRVLGRDQMRLEPSPSSSSKRLA